MYPHMFAFYWHKLFISYLFLFFYFQIVYVARNAKDNVVSYFHFDRMEKMQPEPGDWNSFFQRFKDGKSKWISTLLKCSFRKLFISVKTCSITVY